MLRRSSSRLGQRFFGLTAEDKGNVTLESVFTLMYYGGFTFTEAWNLPVAYRQWFLNRITREINGKSGEGNGSSRGVQHNTQDVRSLQGMTRTQQPARLTRFS